MSTAASTAGITPSPLARVAFFVSRIEGRGIPRVILHYAADLARRGHHVILVVKRLYDADYFETPDGVHLHCLYTQKNIPTIIALRLFLDKARIDVIVSATSGLNACAVLAARSLKKQRRPRVVLTDHNYLSAVLRWFPLRRRLIRRAIIRLTYPLADRVLAVSAGVLEDLRRYTPLPDAQASVLFNPVLVEEIREKAARPSGLAIVDDKTDPLILTVAALEPQKAHEVLLEAFRIVLQTRPAHLLLVGEGSRRGALEKQATSLGIADRVHFVGWQKEPYSFMARADVFALSSRFEGLPVTLLEAMACDLPIVSTDCPAGPAEILENGRYGRLVPVGDSAALADALLATLASGDPRPGAGIDRFESGRICEAFYDMAIRPRNRADAHPSPSTDARAAQSSRDGAAPAGDAADKRVTVT